MENNVSISVKYTLLDDEKKTLGTFSCTADARISPLNHFSKNEMGRNLALSIAEKHAGSSNIEVEDFCVTELKG